jgi:hypothetical protein
MTEKSIWKANIGRVNFPSLYGEIKTDILVVGSG